MEFKDIKLIIWDLDETFWKGVLSDGTAHIIPENISLIKNSTDAGVINSICSKNDLGDVEKFLAELGIKELFVFNSVNWSPKGERVHQIISEMQLRDANVLFIDDNHLNLEEVREACPGITAVSPDIIPSLIDFFEQTPKKDLNHNRLNQYKILEEKKEFKASSGSNEEFLYNCNICVATNCNCTDNLERIYDLVQRSNQLNFTKIRSSRDELLTLFGDSSVKCGYVSVEDKFGDYGIVGFYALRDNTLLHFVFSCRTLNMGVEQYVYNQLGRPELTVIGQVASSLEGGTPPWINREGTVKNSAEKEDTGKNKIVIKGPCDMELIFSFIKSGKNIIKEYVYVGKMGISVEGVNHTSHIVQSPDISAKDMKRLQDTLPFGDSKMFNTDIFRRDISVVYLSLFTDPNLGLYREKSTGIVVAFGEYTNDLTDESIWDDMINHRLFDANCNFTIESLQYIRDNFDFLGRITPEEIVGNLDRIRNRMNPKAKLILNLGSEIKFEANTNPAYSDRHIYHKCLNDLVKEWKSGKDNVYLIELSDYVKTSDDYTTSINHFSKSVYFALAQKFLDIVKDNTMAMRKKQKPRYMRKFGMILTKIKRKLKLK